MCAIKTRVITIDIDTVSEWPVSDGQSQSSMGYPVEGS